MWSKPLFVRISGTDWAEGPEKGDDGLWKQWGIEQSKIFVGELEKIGVDLIDVSSAGNWAAQKIPVGPGYQVRILSLPDLPDPFPNMGHRIRFLSRRLSKRPILTYLSALSVSSPQPSRRMIFSKLGKPTLFSSRRSSSGHLTSRSSLLSNWASPSSRRISMSAAGCP